MNTDRLPRPKPPTRIPPEDELGSEDQIKSMLDQIDAEEVSPWGRKKVTGAFVKSYRSRQRNAIILLLLAAAMAAGSC